MRSSGDLSAAEDPFALLLLESGLATREQVDRSTSVADAHIDETLIAEGIIDPAHLRQVTSLAWKLPIVDLTGTWLDVELVRAIDGETYLAENWLPLHDQANGSVLVATARFPDAERAAEISARLISPVEFVVATAADIRAAVLDAWGANARR
jgi:hypothetical protein